MNTFGLNVVRLLNMAKNQAGENAVAAAKHGHYRKSNEWRAIAVAIADLERRAVAEMAK